MAAQRCVQRRLVLLTASLVLLTTCFAAATMAQPVPSRAPSSTHIFPAGARRGTTVKVLVGGECVPPGADFLLFGDGVSATLKLEKRSTAAGEPSPRRPPTETPINYPKQWESQIKVATDAPLGVKDWRISSAQGGTGARPFVIGDLPEWLERESNSNIKTAERIELPVTLNGQIFGERDNDYFRFQLAKGELLVCEVMAARLGSRLDPIVELLDADGSLLEVEQHFFGADPVLAFRAVEEGDYLLRIANVGVAGSPAHVYRVNLTKRPLIRFAFPPGGRVGETRTFELVCLGGERKPLQVEHSFKVAGDVGSTIALRTDNLAGAAEVRIETAETTVESEPNDKKSDATRLALDTVAYGRLSTRRDEDWYVFEATDKSPVSISCRPAPAMSSALPTLHVIDASGAVIETQRSVDSTTRVARVEWKPKTPGKYLLRVHDLRLGAQGGDDFVYRLAVERSKPDFRLRIDEDIANVVQGRTTSLNVMVERIGAFPKKPIELTVEGLSDGVKASKASLAAGSDLAKLQLTASEDARSTAAVLKVVGSIKIGDRELRRVAQVRGLGVDSEGLAVGAARTERLHLSVAHKPIFRLYCAEAYLYAHRGSVFPYPMHIERLNGFKGAISLQIGDRQNRDLDGIQMLPIQAPADVSDFHMPIYLPETMHINIQSQSQLYTQAYARFVDQHGQQQSVLVVSEKRNMLRTLPTVVKLLAADAQLSAAPGEVIDCPLRLKRTSNFPGTMRVALRESSSQIVSADEAQFAGGESELVVRVKVSDQARPGQRVKLRFRGTGELSGGVRVVSEADVDLDVSAR